MKVKCDAISNNDRLTDINPDGNLAPRTNSLPNNQVESGDRMLYLVAYEQSRITNSFVFSFNHCVLMVIAPEYTNECINNSVYMYSGH